MRKELSYSKASVYEINLFQERARRPNQFFPFKITGIGLICSKF